MPLPSMTYDRMKALLQKEELNFEVNSSDNTITFAFVDLMVWIYLDEHNLRMTAAWRGQSTEAEDGERMLTFAHEANSGRNFPKVYVYGEGREDAPFRILMENPYPIELGISDDQLSEYFNVSMAVFFSVVEAATEEMPHLVTWSEEE